MTTPNTQQLNDQQLEQTSGGAFLGVTPDMLRSIMNHNKGLFRNPSFESFYQQYKGAR